ncbi:hypothetical protein A0126_17110 (plasmid) [Exiguobacterium sp. N4-1P]|uniref:hypothetical protein n=1 Tax=Exiguobacterium sp. N4-1P TaxID=2051906 RepID=UPI000B58F346|nr:hypothetical protein [Exiguobacterium sp. N4-1P]ASI35292.1 hypothetical protein A0126_06835 [Exiguobacterium sp. N4-1P]ASI37305.1 hypothetical protein A0126_17110 [Exiguobacterium sp. N4-1P]
MNIKMLILVFLIVYLALSLPALFGIGLVIDWVPEATVVQKFNGYVLVGLTDNYLFKCVMAGLISIVLQLIISKRQRN